LNALAPAPPAETADAGPRIYGEGNMDARIVLRARGDSWVQIRAPDDSLIMTRTLRAGDSYRVPNQGGLKLMTGNAGSLDIVVDGQATPSLGPYGAVRRNVALDVERLKAGTATPN
jgi:cytoskeleton protein RodZ